MPTLAELLLLLPTIVLAGGACVLMLSEAFLSGGDRRYQAGLAAFVSALALALSVAQVASPIAGLPAESPLATVIRPDLFQAFVSAVVCVGLLLSVLLSASFLRRRDAERGEYYALLLFAGSGMSLLAASNDLVMIFIALEIMSLATYALAAWLRRSPRSSEAALKYFLLGAFSSAIYIYGVALAYGATGSTHLSVIADPETGIHKTLGGMAIGLIVVGFAFKVAAVPFHMWAPDVYEGAPTPVTAFMAVGVKAAAFAAFFRVIPVAFAAAPNYWSVLVQGLAILTMVCGNLLALPQLNVKRMLAYSAVAHAGYALVGLSAASVYGARVEAGESLLFYLAAYCVSAIGAFGIAALIEREDTEEGTAWNLERFAGLAQRRPTLAFLMTLFLLSLAGIPGTAGFIAKLAVFRAALDANQLALVIVGVVTSAIAAFYYLRVIVYMYFHAPDGEASLAPHSAWTSWSLGIAGVAVLVLGIGPGTILNVARHGAQLLFS